MYSDSHVSISLQIPIQMPHVEVRGSIEFESERPLQEILHKEMACWSSDNLSISLVWLTILIQK